MGAKCSQSLKECERISFGCLSRSSTMIASRFFSISPLFFNLLGWFIQVRSFSCCDVAFNQAKIVSTWWLAIFAWQTRAVTSFLQLTARYFLHFWTLDLIRLYFFLQSLIDFLIRRWPSVPISFEFLVFIFQRDLKETSRDNIDIGFSFTH